MKELFKRVNIKTFLVFFTVFSLLNIVVIPKFVNGEEITVPRVVIGLSVSLIVSFVISLTKTPKESNK